MRLSVQFFREVVRALNCTGLDYWLAWGTCLAAVREGHLQSWDQVELDFGSISGELSSLDSARIITMLWRHSLDGLWYIKNNRKLWASLVIWEKESPARVKGLAKLAKGIELPSSFKALPARHAHLDFYKVEDGQIMEVMQLTPKVDGPRFPVSLFASPKEIKFLGQKVRVPNPPEDYLRICYGKDWTIPKKEGWEDDWRSR